MAEIEAPGPPGRKIEYFSRRPRHWFVAPIFLLNAVFSLVIAITQWSSGHPRFALGACVMAVVMTVAAIATWRVGQRQEQQLWTDIHIRNAKVVSHGRRMTPPRD